MSQPTRGASWELALGSAVGTCFAILVLTGLALMTVYAPSPQTAWASVHFAQFVLPGGWIVRGMHFWAAQSMFALAGIHILVGALLRAYRPPREIHWWLTLAVLGLAVGQGITGGLLPWDQRGWWARVVEANIIGLAPVVGGWLAQMMSGGSELGALGLARIHTLHVVVLPLLLGLVFVARRALARREHGASGSPVASSYTVELAAMACVAAVVSWGLFGVVVWAHGAPLDAPADPLSDYPARPEWFLLPLFQLRKLFHGPLEFWGTTLVPGLAVGVLALLPWIDGRSRRGVALVLVALVAGGAVGLGVVGWRHDAADAQYAKARAKWDVAAAAAAKLAMGGVPPAGALDMVRRDPELRGRALFERHCAGCHVLEDLGDPKKATATKLDGWGTAPWIEKMIHDPDAPEFFGQGPYVGQMPSVDAPPKDKTLAQHWTPMIRTPAERKAVALFLARQGAEPGEGEPARDGLSDPSQLAQGEKIVTERCTACHLWKGEGDDGGNGLAPELQGYGCLAWTRAQVANPSSTEVYRSNALDPDLKKHMPRFDKELSAADIDTVARFARAHARASSPAR